MEEPKRRNNLERIAKWKKENTARIVMDVSPKTKQSLQRQAKNNNMSLTRFILEKLKAAGVEL